MEENFLNASLALEILKYFKEKNDKLKCDGLDSLILLDFAKSENASEVFKLLKYIKDNYETVSTTVDYFVKRTRSLTTQCIIQDLIKDLKIEKGEVNINNVINSLESDNETAKDMLALLDLFEGTDKLGVQSFLNRIKNEAQSSDDVLKLVDKLQKQKLLKSENAAAIISKLSDQSVDGVTAVVKKSKQVDCIDDAAREKIFKNFSEKAKTTEDVANMFKLLNLLDLTLTSDNYTLLFCTNENRSVDYVCSLLYNLKNHDIKLDDKCFEFALGKLKYEGSNVDDICGFISHLKKIGIKLTTEKQNKNRDENQTYVINALKKLGHQNANELSTLAIFLSQESMLTHDILAWIINNKLSDNQSASDVADFLITAGDAIDWKNICAVKLISFSLDEILGHIASNQNAADVLKLAKALIGTYKNLTIYPDRLKDKVGQKNPNDNNSGNPEELQNLLGLNPNKEKKKYEKKREAIIKEFKNLNKIKTANANIDNLDYVDINNNSCLFALLQQADISVANKYKEYCVVGEKARDGNEEVKSAFARVVMKALINKLNLLSDQYANSNKSRNKFKTELASEKKFLQGINCELLKVKLLSDEEYQKANRYIDDIYDLSGFVTFLQWLGCVLSVLVTFGLSLLFGCIKGRVCFHTESLRMADRLKSKSNQDTLVAPLQNLVKTKDNLLI